MSSYAVNPPLRQLPPERWTLAVAGALLACLVWLAFAISGCSCPAAVPTRAFAQDVEKFASVSAPGKDADPAKWEAARALIVSNARTVAAVHS